MNLISLTRTTQRTAVARLFPPLWLPLLLAQPPTAGAEPVQPARQPVDYLIIVTGGELLMGTYADTHTHFLTRTLRPLGLRCVGSMSVDDRKADIKDALRFAAGKADLVIVTGGPWPHRQRRHSRHAL